MASRIGFGLIAAGPPMAHADAANIGAACRRYSNILVNGESPCPGYSIAHDDQGTHRAGCRRQDLCLRPAAGADRRACATAGLGELLAVTSHDAGIGPALEAWCRFTRNALIETTAEAGRMRWVFRYGEAPAEVDLVRPVGARLWLYTNFDCNLRCDYCCVRSSPEAPRRALGLERVRQIASEAAGLGVSEIFVTGGEPFLLPEIGGILAACTAVAPTTVLTNGMLLVGRRLETLRALPRDRLTLQISLDSPTPERHDRAPRQEQLGKSPARHRPRSRRGIPGAVGGDRLHR